MTVSSSHQRAVFILSTEPAARTLLKKKIAALSDQLSDLKEKESSMRKVMAQLEDTYLNRIRMQFDDTHFALLRAPLETQLKKMKRLLYLSNPRTSNPDPDFTALIEQARTTPIQDLFTPASPFRTSSRIKCLCPFPDHSEKTASFTIYLDTNSYYCFGCAKGGDSIDFIQKLHSLSFKEAIHFITNTTK